MNFDFASKLAGSAGAGGYPSGAGSHSAHGDVSATAPWSTKMAERFTYSQKDFVTACILQSERRIMARMSDLEQRLRYDLKEEVQRLESRTLQPAIRKQSEDGQPNTGVPETVPPKLERSMSMKRNFGPRNSSEAAATYQDAFLSLGGHSEVERFRELSQKLQQRVVDKKIQKTLAGIFPDMTMSPAFTKFPVYQHYVEDFQTLLDHASSCHESFDDVIRTLAERTHGEVMLSPLKSKKRAQMKAKFKYKSETTGEISWYRLTDLVRATIMYPSIAKMYHGLEAVVEGFTQTGKVLELNDRYIKELPGGYRDVQMVVEYDGHLCELQLNTAAMVATKETAGHLVYDVRRELVEAVRQGDVEQISDTLTWGELHLGSKEALKGVLDTKDKSGTLLHEAARQGNDRMIYKLLELQGDPDIQDLDGNTPMHLAQQHGFDAVCWVLLDAGQARWDLENKAGMPPLLVGLLTLRQRPDDESAARAVSTLAWKAGAEHVLEVGERVESELKKRLHNSHELVDYAADGRVDKMEIELREFADPDSYDRQGNLALVVAAQNGREDAVQTLLDFKASIEHNGSKALEVAIQHRRHGSVTVLISGGVRIPQTGDLVLSFIEDAGPGGFQWAGGACGADGNIYCAPFDANYVLVINPRTRSLGRIDGVGDGERKYFGICLGPDGRLYCAPHHSNKVLVINPTPPRGTTNKLSFIEGAGESERKYAGIALGSDGRLYCTPRHETRVLVIDPSASEGGGQLSFLEGPDDKLSKEFKYSGMCEGPDGKLYCASQTAKNMLVIDPRTQQLSFIEDERLHAPFQYSAICKGPDGRLYCAPFNAKSVLVYDTTSETLSFLESPVLSQGVMSQYSSICMGVNKNLYCSSENSDKVLVVKTGEMMPGCDPKLEFINGTGSDKGKWLGICSGTFESSRLFCVPYRSSTVLEIDPRPATFIARELGGKDLEWAMEHPNEKLARGRKSGGG